MYITGFLILYVHWLQSFSDSFRISYGIVVYQTEICHLHGYLLLLCLSTQTDMFCTTWLLTWEVCLQICHEFERFSTYLPDIKVAVFYGGVNIKTHKDLLKNECPHIVVGTPGRILGLTRDKDLSLKSVRHFILDECDKMLESLGMSSLLLGLHGYLVHVCLLGWRIRRP